MARLMRFKLVSKFSPTGDQPQAIEKLSENIEKGVNHQVLLGVTGSGKTFTMAQVIEKTQRPALVICPNKTLAAQLYQEFKSFFPENSVHYFVSYYDYYQPEAYIPQTDTYIEKDSRINEEIDRMRHAAVQDLLSRRDNIIVASVSCIYNIGSPEDYQKVSWEVKSRQKIKRTDFLLRLAGLQYERNDIDFKPATFRVRGDVVEIFLVTGEEVVRVEFEGDQISAISTAQTSTKNFLNLNFKEKTELKLYPAHFWVTPQEKMKIAMANIRLELQERLKELKKQKKLLEAQRLEQKTNYDLEMMEEMGYCHGIENYSRQMEFRKSGESPYVLLDYFPKDFLIFIDESHQTLPQLHAMAVQDRARKKILIDYGFRLPSAIDNRPLTFDEFDKKISQAVYVSATPAQEEKIKSRGTIVEQLIRPTGLLEPAIEIRPAENQVADLIDEIKKTVAKKQRVLAVTLTKRLAEAISDHLKEQGIKTQWLHSEVKTLERPKILRDLREGKFDVLVGINLLREGLDLPEVGLVAILDADKEGFLRSETTLIQTMGRAARHLEGRVILYGDKITYSMSKALKEIERRKNVQADYNKKHHITPKAISKEIKEWEFAQKKDQVKMEFWQVQDIKILEKEMQIAAENLDFERAAEIRDIIAKIKQKGSKE